MILVVRIIIALFICVPLVALGEARLENIATRGFVGSGDNVLIGGFVITGSISKQIVIRARGPALSSAGVSDALVDPEMMLFSGSTLIEQNDDWQDHEKSMQIPSRLRPIDSRESALMTMLAPGAYTVIVQGVGDTDGIGLVEVFEVNLMGEPHLINIATRGFVGIDDAVLIGGLVISGTGALDVVIRAKGPSLAEAQLMDVLPDPQITLFSGLDILSSNDNWQDLSVADSIPEALKPTHPSESVIFTSLMPGAYTVIVSGVGGTTGIGLVEVFDVGRAVRGTRPLNDTGIVFGGNYPIDNNITCIGAVIDEQDCRFGRDVTHNNDNDGHAGFSFTKLDAAGIVLPASAESWSCVRDNVTGLIWEVKTADSGIHDKDMTFRWGGKAADQSGSEFYSDWNVLVDATNTEKLCGSTEWHVPSVRELFGIMNLNQTEPAIDLSYFPNSDLEDGLFWTSSATAKNSDSAWSIDLFYGSTGTNLRNTSSHVQLVSSKQILPTTQSSDSCVSDIPRSTPDFQFVDNLDGTVSDSVTGLMWKQCSEGQENDADCTGTRMGYNWESALQVSSELNKAGGFAGYQDWRVPNVKELQSLIENACRVPAINSNFFPNTDSTIYWTGSPGVGFGASLGESWYVDFYYGTVSPRVVGAGYFFGRSDFGAVRLVRGDL